MDGNDQDRNSGYKLIFSLYINSEIARRFDEQTRHDKLAASTIIEQLMTDWLDSQEKKQAPLEPEPYSVI